MDYTSKEIEEMAREQQARDGYVLKDARPLGDSSCIVETSLGSYVVFLPAREVREGETIRALERDEVRVRRMG